MSVMPHRMFADLRFPWGCLKPANVEVRAANSHDMTVAGAFEAVISATTRNGEPISSMERIYVVEGAEEFYLSCEAMVGLGIIDREFPLAGSAKDNSAAAAMESGRTTEAVAMETEPTTCDCTPRAAPPGRPSELTSAI